jgi:hypothetical protein
MRKSRFIILSVVVAFISVTVVLGFSSLMMAKAQVWSAEHRPLPVHLVWAVNTASQIQRGTPVVVVGLVAASFASVALLGRLIHRHDNAA